jgi:DNA-binding response OmpR family regulator
MATSSATATSPLILVVDDDPEVRRLLAGGLSVRGFRVQLAANGREGMDRLRAEVPRLVVLDFWMPVLDGAGFMQEMRDFLPKRPPVILFTAVHDKPDLVRSLGVDVYVEKPIQMSRFVKLVEATLRGAAVVGLPEEPGGRERRVRARFVHRRTVEIRLPGANTFRSARTIDVSEGGLCLELGDGDGDGHGAGGGTLPKDAHLGVAVELRDGRRVELDGLVKHVRDGRIGVQFLPLDSTRAAAVQILLHEAGA